MNPLQIVFKQTAFQILGKAVTAVSTFIILALMARSFGEEGTGIFTLVLTYISMFMLLADFGFNAHVLKLIQKEKPQAQSDIWRRLFGTRVVWAFILIMFSIFFLPFLPFAGSSFFYLSSLASFAIFGSAVFISVNLLFQSKLRYDLSVLATSVGTTVYLILAVLLALSRMSLVYIIFAYVLGWIIISAVSLFLVKRFVASIYPIFDIKFTLKILKACWPIATTLTLNVVYFRADSFMIAYFRNVSEAGIYNIAYQLFQTALVLPAFIMNAYYPMMLRSLAGIKTAVFFLLGLATVGTLITYILSPFVLKILTGGGFEGASQSLQILSLGFPAYFLSALLMWLMVTKGMYKQMLGIYGFGLLLNVVLNFLYIPTYSFIAAAATTVICEYLILFMQVVIVTRNK